MLACLLLAVTFATPGEATADAARKRCNRTCGADAKACLDVGRARVGPFRQACAAGASARSCKRAAQRISKVSRSSCRRLRKDCRACCRAGGSGPACPVGRVVGFEPPPAQNVAALGLPQLPSGNLFALAIPGATLEIDPTLRSPVTALGGCTRWITACVAPAVRSLDDCARSAPVCGTERPWEEPVPCCPAACFTAYERARRAGAAALAAFETTYFVDAGCFPGLRALRDGGAP